MKKFIFFTVIIVLIMPGLSVSATQQRLQQAEREKANNARDLRNAQNDLRSTRAEMNRVELEIIELDIKLLDAMDNLDAINQSLDETIARLERTEQELDQARKELDTQFEVYRERLRVMHEYGPVSFIAVLFQASGFLDFLSRLEYMNDVAKYDQQLVDKLEEAEKHVAFKAEELARQKNTVEALQLRQLDYARELEKTLEERYLYFEKLDEDELLYQEKVDALAEAQKVIDKAYADAKAADDQRKREEARRAALMAANFNGRLLWPAPVYTRITDEYGERIHPIRKKKEFHTGVDIASPTGNNILAAEGGTVILARYNGGYGNCIIIDHGGGLSTLYGHASRILVSVGQQVRRGSVIARIGSTGVSTGPHLHFEVHVDGKHTNPKSYLNYTK